jgi:CheY-like chemotaxis protein
MKVAKPLADQRVLLVEDSRDILEVFALLLEAEGAEVTPVATGRAALEAAAHRTYDILLTDLGLPDVPGDLVIRQVLATAARRPLVVVVTGYDEPFIGRAREAGADAVLTKPITWPTLMARLAPAASPLAA